MPNATLTRKGKTAWRIALPAKAGKVERFSADELAKYIRQMSGATLKIVARKATSPSSPIIRLGLRKDLGRVSSLPAAAEGFDGYSVLVSPKTIVIAGDTPIGVLYGVYDLLERLGCRWYHPTIAPEDPEVIPHNPDLVLSPAKWSEGGKVENRWYNGSAFFCFDLVAPAMHAQLDWAAKNRFNGIGWQSKPENVEGDMIFMRDNGVLEAITARGLRMNGPGHSFPFFLPSKEYFAQHPEWFGMLNGERRPYEAGWPIVNHCWSNADATRQMIDNMVAFLKRWPQVSVFSPVWTDGGKFCECPECQKEGNSNLLIALFNQIADRMEKEVPAITVESVVGYPPVEDVPTTTQANGKWMGLYAHWGRNLHNSYRDPNYGRRPNMLVWSSFFPGKFELWSYYAASSHQTFHAPPFLHALEGDARFCVEHGIKGQFVQHYPHGFWWNFSFNMKMGGLLAYYYPNRMPKDELRDYALHYFGPKAGPLLYDLFEIMGTSGEDNLAVSYRATGGGATEGDMAILREWDKMLDRAAFLAKDDPTVSYRIGKLRGVHAILMQWAPAHRYRANAEEKLELYRKDEASREDVANAIAEGKAYIEQLLTHAAEVEAQYPGVMQAAWLKSWWTDRTITPALLNIERKLEGLDAAQKSAKPHHVAAMD